MVLCYSKTARIAVAATALLLFLTWGFMYSDSPWTMPFESSLIVPFVKPDTVVDSKLMPIVPLPPPVMSAKLNNFEWSKELKGEDRGKATSPPFYTPSSVISKPEISYTPVTTTSQTISDEHSTHDPPSATAPSISTTKPDEPPSQQNDTSANGDEDDDNQAPEPSSSNPPTNSNNNSLLILFAYYETPSARQNLEFFLRHGLHAHGDFIFIFNGETDAETLLPKRQPNIRYVKRLNRCYDLGAYGEILNANDQRLVKRYERFILLNASLRGPFMPFWSRECWSEAYLSKLSDKVKLVGMTINCTPTRHVQSMLLATDRTGLSILLNTTDPSSLSACPPDMPQAISVETHLTDLVKSHGYTVAAMMTLAWTRTTYVDDCTDSDLLFPGAYNGTNIHAYETLFVKTERRTDPVALERLTEWHDGSGYSSYGVC